MGSGLKQWAGKAATSFRALSKLGDLPRAKHGVAPPPPLVLDDKEHYHDACEKAGCPGHLAPEIAAAPIMTVPIAGIHTIQGSVNPGRVAQYLHNPGLMPPGARGKHGGPVDTPIVVQANGKRWLHDGHHRAVAGILKGETAIKARFVDLDR